MSLGAEARDHIHLCPGRMQGLGDGVRDRAAQSAADHGRLADAVQMGRLPQRGPQIVQRFALFELAQLQRAGPTFWKMMVTVPACSS